MQKNWLIRTKSNHILGPVSKEKVLELYHNGSIRQEDEICSGNGYWFYVREKDQLERYLLGNQKQSFNPISEARDVLTADLDSHKVGYDVQDDITLVSGIDISGLKNDLPPTSAQSVKPSGRAPSVVAEKKNEILAVDVKESTPEDLPPPPIKPRHRDVASTPTPLAPGRAKKGTTVVPPPRVAYVPKKRLISDKIVMMGAILILLTLAGMLYYRKRLLNEFMQISASSIIPSAYAQSESIDIKKKVFLSRLQ
jgi:hypothetical protein